MAFVPRGAIPTINLVVYRLKSQQSFIKNGGAFVTVYCSFILLPNLSLFVLPRISFPRNLNAVDLSFSIDEG